ncbi:hypothetical protein ACFFQW_06680 [Umezawaea endophytica]|uniref:Uncharacterized protein n=1 Tax=Umezawaea endophytica TaxID=1654476 RepID=A0A9X2VQS0_9PSEU|nr:hypothetical protein [Umezawaea endophytica]MCS7480986.1 hypothetical protein [Umezawaea endophytica]
MTGTRCVGAEGSATGPVVGKAGASPPVLGGASHGGRSATACSAHLAAARDPVPRQVSRTASGKELPR